MNGGWVKQRRTAHMCRSVHLYPEQVFSTPLAGLLIRNRHACLPTSKASLSPISAAQALCKMMANQPAESYRTSPSQPQSLCFTHNTHCYQLTSRTNSNYRMKKRSSLLKVVGCHVRCECNHSCKKATNRTGEGIIGAHWTLYCTTCLLPG